MINVPNAMSEHIKTSDLQNYLKYPSLFCATFILKKYSYSSERKAKKKKLCFNTSKFACTIFVFGRQPAMEIGPSQACRGLPSLP